MARPYHKQSVLATVKFLVSARPTTLEAWSVVNNAAILQSVACYNANAVADVTVGTTVPDFMIPVPANATPALGAGNNLAPRKPPVFEKGLVIAMIEGMLDTGSTGAANNSLNVNLVVE